MAPARVFDTPSTPVEAGKKETVYVLDTFPTEVIKHCQKHFHTILPGSSEHSQWRSHARYLLVRSSYVTKSDIESCPNLLAIGKQGVGIDKIDADACAARNIKILNTPGANARAVAELVLTLASSVAREVGTITSRQTAGYAVPKESCSGLILSRKTIAILGMGHIGKTVAQIFRGAFDASVVAYDPFLPRDAWSDIEHVRVDSINEALKLADIVTIHVPLTPQTRNLIAYEEFKLMKPTAILINAARGGIVNEADLERALSEQLIWGAGLDCHEQEPPTIERYGKLWKERVVSTPHIGAATSQTQLETAKAAIDRLYAFSQNK